jgi:hypothetical protein
MKPFLSLLVLAAGLALAQGKFKPIFDGHTFSGWRDVRLLNVPGNAFSIEDGAIKSNRKPWINEDLFSLGEYEDFELEFEWKISPGGNSGIKYRLQDAVFLNESLPRPVKKFEETLRDEYERRPSDRAKLKPEEHGQLYKGDDVEHWVNGELVLKASLKSPMIAAGAKARWGETHPVYKLLVEQPKRKSPILIQNHGDEAWFRKLRVKRL